MDERDLRGLLDQVKAGADVASRLRAAYGGGGAGGADGEPASRPVGRGDGAIAADLQADQARRRRASEGAVVAGPDLAEPALRRRHQGPGRLAPVLRAAGAAGTPTATCGRSWRRSIPGREDGTLAADGKSVTWKLKKGVKWHDGQPFTADDVVFTWQYFARSGDGRASPAAPTATSRSRRSISIHVIVKFQQPTPFWADAFVAAAGMHHPQAPVRRLYRRQVARGADQPQAGRHRPYMFKDFKPGDLVAGVINPNYHVENRPALRRHRDEGRRRCGLGGARRAADRASSTSPGTCRSRTRSSSSLEKGGKGRIIYQPRAAASSTSSSTTPIRGPRSTASARVSRPSIRS